MTADSMIRNSFLWVALIVAAFGLMLIPKSAHGQTAFGEISGTVTDSSGGGIPGAAVTVTNTGTGLSRQVKTDQLGDYRAVSLLPGPYQVRAEQPGFQISQSNVVDVIVGTTVSVNLTMQVGSVTQTIEVTAKLPLLNTESGTVGTVVEHTSVVTLPLNGRAYTDLILLTPGAVPLATAFGYEVGPGHNYSISGVSYEQNNYTLDGIYDTETYFGQFAIQPSVDALQEFNVQSNITSARYGGGAGAVVNVVTKSGTNQLHGAGWEFVRNQIFDANEFFRNYSNLGKNAYRQNQYGGVLSGPLFIPHFYDGRDRTFWMFNYEALKERQSATNFATIPTAAQFGGNLQGLSPVYDPVSTKQVGTDPAGNPIYSRTQISCNGVLNVICPNSIDPAITDYVGIWYPMVTQGGANNYVNTSGQPLNQYQITSRIDHKISDKLQFFGRYSQSIANQITPLGLPTDNFILYNAFKSPMASFTYLWNPTTVVDLKLGFFRDNIIISNSNPAPGAIAFLASHPMSGVSPRSAVQPAYPELSLSGYTGVSSRGNPLQENTSDVTLNISKMKGRHSIETGFRLLRTNAHSDGIYNSDWGFTNVPTANPQDVSHTGSPIASYLLGLPSSGTTQEGDTACYESWTDYAFYGQDNIKVTRKLTVDVGLRWEYNQWPVEKRNHLSDFDTDLGEFVWAGNNPVTGQGPNVPHRSIMFPYYRAFAPRLGLAYQVTPSTTLRGGYGLFYTGDYFWDAQGVRGEWPYAVSNNGSGTNAIFPDMPMEAYWPNYTTPQPGTPPTAAWTEHQHQKTAYTQQWNLGIQHEFTRNTLLEVNYIGNHGLHMPIFYAGNPALPGPGTIGTPAHPRAFPQVGPLSGLGDQGSSDYHALQAKFEKRFANGLQFLASYAWGHYMDLGGASFALSTAPQNPYNWRADWANGTYDFRHIFTASYIYQLPFGNGKRWLTNANPVAKQVLGGWTGSGITHYTTGPPVNIGIPFDNANSGSGQRPDFIPGFPARVISTSDRTKGWLNPASYVVASQYTYGNLGRNTARGPGFGNWDFGLYKDFNIHEGRQYFQFRAEGFNVFNIVDFSAPSSTISTPSFGDISSTVQPAREIQLALKFVF